VRNDGFSPPSYTGLLWCLGHGDKPAQDGGVSLKYSSLYKMTPSDFDTAKATLLASKDVKRTFQSFFAPPAKRTKLAKRN